MIRTSRRIAATITVVCTVTAGMVVTTAGAAHAGNCHSPRATLSFENNKLIGHHWTICQGNPKLRIPEHVKIERLEVDASPLPPDPDRYYWVIVAEGGGDVAYTCKGATPNTFQVNGGVASGIYACS